MLLARPVTQAAVMHQRRGAAAIKVQRVRRSKPNQRFCEFGERHPRVASRTPVAGDREQPLAGDRERCTRIAPIGDIGVKLTRAGREPLDVLALKGHATPPSDEQRTSLQQVPRRLRRDLVASRDPQHPISNVHASANITPRRIERHRWPRVAADAQFAERLFDGRSRKPPTSAWRTPCSRHQRTSGAGRSSTTTRALNALRS